MKNVIQTLWVAGICSLAILLTAHTAPPKYSEGQVWEYKTRLQDTGSLLKIQRVELAGTNKIYHLSIIGVHFAKPGIAGVLPHIPVSDETLDASVVKLSSATPAFPTSALDEGITEWRKANGGVFTISVSQIIDIIDGQMTQANLDTGS